MPRINGGDANKDTPPCPAPPECTCAWTPNQYSRSGWAKGDDNSTCPLRGTPHG